MIWSSSASLLVKIDDVERRSRLANQRTLPSGASRCWLADSWDAGEKVTKYFSEIDCSNQFLLPNEI